MLFWLIYILLEAFVQGKSIQAGNKPSYIILFVIRAMVSIFHGILLAVQPGAEYWILLIFQICSFYVLFDPILNLLRIKPWDYQGKESGYLDKLPKKTYYALKSVCLFGAIYFYYIGLNYWKF